MTIDKAIFAYWAFGISALFFIVAIILLIFLVIHFTKNKRYKRQIGLYLRQGYELRAELLAVKDSNRWTDELQKKEAIWEAQVQQWLENNLPEYAPDFPLEIALNTDAFLSYDNVIADASSQAQRLESRLTNLREILRDIRR